MKNKTPGQSFEFKVQFNVLGWRHQTKLTRLETSHTEPLTGFGTTPIAAMKCFKNLNIEIMLKFLRISIFFLSIRAVHAGCSDILKDLKMAPSIYKFAGKVTKHTTEFENWMIAAIHITYSRFSQDSSEHQFADLARSRSTIQIAVTGTMFDHIGREFGKPRWTSTFLKVGFVDTIGVPLSLETSRATATAHPLTMIPYRRRLAEDSLSELANLTRVSIPLPEAIRSRFAAQLDELTIYDKHDVTLNGLSYGNVLALSTSSAHYNVIGTIAPAGTIAKKNLDVLYDVLDRLVQNRDNWDKVEQSNLFVICAYIYFTTVPYEAGSAAIGRVYFTALSYYLFGRNLIPNPDIDLLAMRLRFDSFKNAILSQ